MTTNDIVVTTPPETTNAQDQNSLPWVDWTSDVLQIFQNVTAQDTAPESNLNANTPAATAPNYKAYIIYAVVAVVAVFAFTSILKK